MRIAVGVITRRRPELCARLLDSLAAMVRPAGHELLFIVVENDTTSGMSDTLEAFQKRVAPLRLVTDLEPRTGIPVARNRVLDLALSEGCDVLCFVDDDERVHVNWLVELVSGLTDRNLDLVGGPVRPVAPPGPSEALDWGARSVLAHVQARSAQRNAQRAKAAAKGQDRSVDVYTNNWGLRLSTQRRLDLRFDENLQISGGSDTRFSRQALSLGAKLGWIPDAVVDEPIPLRRLSLSYYFRRARDQATNAGRLREKSKSSTLGMAALRTLGALVAVLAWPINGTQAPAKAVHRMGVAVGLAKSAFGGASSHYRADKAQDHQDRPNTRTPQD